MIRHITLFRVNDEVPRETIERAITLLQGLGVENEFVMSWEVAESLDTRRGTVLVVNSVFTDQEALTGFTTSERHIAVAQVMRPIATWLVADYLTE